MNNLGLRTQVGTEDPRTAFAVSSLPIRSCYPLARYMTPGPTSDSKFICDIHPLPSGDVHPTGFPAVTGDRYQRLA